DSPTILRHSDFPTFSTCTGTVTALAFVVRVLISLIPIDDSIELIRVVSPAMGKSIWDATTRPVASLATMNENSPRATMETPSLVACRFAAESFAPVQQPHNLPMIA